MGAIRRAKEWITEEKGSVRIASQYEAMKHARSLSGIECGGRSVTFNHYFNANLQKRCSERICQSTEVVYLPVTDSTEEYVPVSALNKHAAIWKMDNRYVKTS